MDVTADPDLARSSDTTSADAELPTSTYKEATLLLEQLHVDHTGMFSSHFVFSCYKFLFSNTIALYAILVLYFDLTVLYD